MYAALLTKAVAVDIDAARALLLRYFGRTFCVRACSVALAFNKIEFPALQLPFGALREAPRVSPD